jgi:hypothetical protein
MIIKTYKHKSRIVCYIEQTESGQFKTCTGKPSDTSRIAWTYNTLKEAEITATEYFNNYTQGV